MKKKIRSKWRKEAEKVTTTIRESMAENCGKEPVKASMTTQQHIIISLGVKRVGTE